MLPSVGNWAPFHARSTGNVDTVAAINRLDIRRAGIHQHFVALALSSRVRGLSSAGD
jgi:hypothetical protein